MAKARSARKEIRRRLVFGMGCAVGAMVISTSFASDRTIATDNAQEILMADTSLKDEIHGFLTAYNQAFETFDGPKIAPFYHAPCITVRGDGSIHSFQTQSEIEKFFRGVAEKYSSDGYRSGTFYDLHVVPIGGRSVLATLTWEQLREDKSILRKWRHSYNLVRVQGGWKILASTFHLA